MARMRHLATVAYNGFADMAPALRRAFNSRGDDDRLNLIFGRAPRRAILLITVATIIAGEAFRRLTPDFTVKQYINWSVVCTSIVFALLIRRYLFVSGKAASDDFPWLAATLVPAALGLVVVSMITHLVAHDVELLTDAPFWTFIGFVLELLATSTSVAAALTIAVAALCYSRNWVNAFFDLAIQLAAFKFVLAFLAFMMLEVGIMDRIISSILEGVFRLRFPEWVGVFADQISYAALLFGFYFAIIGATWIVCREHFATLLTTGDVSIVKAVKAIIQPEKHPEKKAAKAEKKAAKKAEKMARRAERKAAKISDK